MFYDVFVSLCKEKGIAPYKAARLIGFPNNSIVAQWARGSTPRGDTLQRIADYFEVPVEYLLTKDESLREKEQTVRVDGLSEGETMLLSAFRSLTPEQRRLVLVQLQALAQLPADQAAAE